MGKLKKSTRKFMKNHLKDTISLRRKNAKNKPKYLGKKTNSGHEKGTNKKKNIDTGEY